LIVIRPMPWRGLWRDLAGRCRGQILSDSLDCTRCRETFPMDRYACARQLNHPLRQIHGGARKRRAWYSVASGALPLKPQAEQDAHKGRVAAMPEAMDLRPGRCSHHDSLSTAETHGFLA
jgi:hypothetical protein